MTNTTDHTAESIAPVAPWIQHLDEELSQSQPDVLGNGLCLILRRLVLSTNDSAATDAAQQVDEYYCDHYLPSDPLLKLEDDKGMEAFLNTLYGLVFELACLVPYNHDLQQLLVNFVIELVKLPAKKVKIWNEECLVYTKEPIFGSVMEENWNARYPSDSIASDDPAAAESYKEWLNLSAFLARCIQSGRNDSFENWSKYPGVDIPKGLEENHDQGPRRKYLLLAALQYLLLAGEKLHSEFISRHPDGSEKRRWGLGKWQLWAGKLQEIAGGQETDADVRQDAEKARRLMLLLEPQTQP
ncbi:hypothetical protein EsH8_II_000456 [Colletotrichum jinshuiense]